MRWPGPKPGERVPIWAGRDKNGVMCISVGVAVPWEDWRIRGVTYATQDYHPCRFVVSS